MTFVSLSTHFRTKMSREKEINEGSRDVTRENIRTFFNKFLFNRIMVSLRVTKID